MIDKLKDTCFTLKIISQVSSAHIFTVCLHILLFTMFSKTLATSSTVRLFSGTLFSLPNSAGKTEGERGGRCLGPFLEQKQPKALV